MCGRPAAGNTTGTAVAFARMRLAAGAVMPEREPSPLAFLAGLVLAFLALLAVLWMPVVL